MRGMVMPLFRAMRPVWVTGSPLRASGRNESGLSTFHWNTVHRSDSFKLISKPEGIICANKRWAKDW
jgi:hypothetical protein